MIVFMVADLFILSMGAMPSDARQEEYEQKRKKHGNGQKNKILFYLIDCNWGRTPNQKTGGSLNPALFTSLAERLLRFV